MRSKDHHLKRRGRNFYLRYDIPKDLRDCFPGQPVRGIEESLKTTDKALARRLRDERLGDLEGRWTAVRSGRRMKTASGHSSPVDSYELWAMQVRRGEVEADDFETALDEGLSRAEDRQDPEEAKKIHLAMEIARGRVTPIREVADEYLSTIEHLNASTLSTRRKAIKALIDRGKVQTVEEVDKRKARVFLNDLMTGHDAISRRTVNQYCQAYRGIWSHLALDTGIWSLTGMGSSVKATKRLGWSDEEYIQLLKAAEERGERDMVLAIRVAAHTGAAAQGIASAQLMDGDTDRPSIFLTETKKDHRSRKVPCHPAIVQDVREWMGDGGLTSSGRRHDQISLSRKFTRLKDSLGYGREKVLHSFRHSVANKLENARAYDREIKRLLGHHIPDITFGTYSAQGLDYDVLRDVVLKIKWPDQPR